MQFRRMFVGFFLVISMCLYGVPGFAVDTSDYKSVMGDPGAGEGFGINGDGDLLPLADSTLDIGADGSEVNAIYVDTLVVGGDSVTGASQLATPMEDQGTYVRIQGDDDVKLYDNGNVVITGDMDADSYIMENDAQLDNAVNSTVTLKENSDTLSIAFTGDDVTLDSSDGGISVLLTDASDGTFDVYCNNVTTDGLVFSQGTNQSTITATGSGNDLYLVAAGGDINLADETVTGTGNMSIGGLTCTSITGFTSMTLTDDVLSLSADDTLEWASNDEASYFLISGYTAKDAVLQMACNDSATSGNQWNIYVDNDDDNLEFFNETTELITFGSGGNIDMVAGTTLTMGNDEVISNATDNTIQIYSSSAAILDVRSTGTSGTTAAIKIQADNATDILDGWQLLANDSATGTLVVGCDSATSETYVAKMTIAGADGDITTTGDVEIIDDMDLVIGSGGDVKIQYDEAGDDQLLIQTYDVGAAATTDPLVEVLVPATPTADQDVFSVAKGDTQASVTQLFVVDEDGDVDVTNNFTAGGTAVITGKITGNGDALLAGTTPLLTIGDGGNEDAGIVFDGQSTKDFYMETDNADDTLIIGVGSTVGTDERIRIDDNATQTTVTLGDAAAGEDTVLLMTDESFTFHIAVDDSDDTLEIGWGSTVETDERITINGSTTESRIEFGDGAAEDNLIVFDGQSDMYMGIDDAGTYADDLVIGVGSVMATTPGIVIADTSANVTIVPDFSVTGGDITFSSATASKPVLTFSSTVVGATSSSTVYDHTRGGVDAVDGDDIHTDTYSGYDDGTPTVDTYVTVLYEMTDTAVGAEDGNVEWTVVSGGSDVKMLELDGIDGIAINPGTVDVDFKVDGNDTADLVVVDAGTNDVVITRALAAGGTTDQAVLSIDNTSATGDVGVLSVTNAAAASATEATVVIQSSATGMLKSSLFVNHDGTAGATTEAAVVIDTDDVNTAALYLMSPNTAAGTTSQIDDYVLAVVAEGVGGGASLYRNVSASTEALLNVREVHADSTAPLVNINTAADGSADDAVVTIQASNAAHDTSLLAIVNAGVGRTAFVDSNVTTAATLVPTMEIDSQATNGAALIVRGPTTLTGSDADFDDFVMAVSAEGVGGGLHVNRNVDDPTGPLVRICDDLATITTSNDNTLEVVCDGDASVSAAVVSFLTTDAGHDQPVLSLTQAGTGTALTIVSGALAVDGDSLTCDGDLTITPAGSEVGIVGGLCVGSLTAVGNDNFKVDGTSLLVGAVTLTADIDIDGGDITAPADLTITPAGLEVIVMGGLAVGDATQVGDDNFSVAGTAVVSGTSQLKVKKTATVADATDVLTSADYGTTIFYTYAGDVTVTLPANGAAAGSWVRCMNANSNTTDVLVNAATADTLITFNDVDADGVEFATGNRIGSSVMCISNGSFWVAINENGSCTMTVVDA